LLGLLVLAYVISLIAVFLTPIAAGWRAGLVLVATAFAIQEWHRLPGSGSRAPGSLRVYEHGAVEIGRRDGSFESASLAGARVFPELVVLELRCGGRILRLPLVADAVAAVPFRRLRAMLVWRDWRE